MQLLDAIDIAYRHRHTYDVLDAAQVQAAYETMRQVRAAYDALAPDWSDAPGWAMWYAIDADGLRAWYEPEPEMAGDMWHSFSLYRAVGLNDEFEIPTGIDWRLCKWARDAQGESLLDK